MTTDAKRKERVDRLIRPELDEIERHKGMKKIDVLGGWRGRPYQREFWDYMMKGGRFASIVWPRRAGKDELSMRITCVLAHKTVGDYWHMIPEANQGRKAIWEATNSHTGRRRIDEIFPEEIRARTVDQSMMIEFKNGSTWRVVGSDNFNSLVGSSARGMVFSEWGLANPLADAYLSPMIRENGGWMIYNTTPRGPNHALDTHTELSGDPDGFAQLLTADDTQHISDDELQDDLRKKQAKFGQAEGYALWRQEWFCTWTALSEDSFIPGSLAIEASEREERAELHVGREKVLGVDVARKGKDRTVIVPRAGYIMKKPRRWEITLTEDVVNHVRRIDNTFQADAIHVDAGYNPGVVDNLRRIPGIGHKVVEVNFGGASPSAYAANWRSDMYREMKLWLERGGVIPKDDELIDELSYCQAKFEQNVVKLESKHSERLKKLGLRSPDLADAAALTFAAPVQPSRIAQREASDYTYASERERQGDHDPFADYRV